MAPFLSMLQTNVRWLPTPNRPLHLPCFTVHSLQPTSGSFASMQICEATEEDLKADVYENVEDMKEDNEYMNLEQARETKVSEQENENCSEI